MLISQFLVSCSETGTHPGSGLGQVPNGQAHSSAHRSDEGPGGLLEGDRSSSMFCKWPPLHGCVQMVSEQSPGLSGTASTGSKCHRPCPWHLLLKPKQDQGLELTAVLLGVVMRETYPPFTDEKTDSHPGGGVFQSHAAERAEPGFQRSMLSSQTKASSASHTSLPLRVSVSPSVQQTCTEHLRQGGTVLVARVPVVNKTGPAPAHTGSSMPSG